MALIGLVGLAACDGDSDGGSGADLAESVCRRLNNVIAAAIDPAGPQITPQELRKQANALADDGQQAADEDSTYSQLANGLDQFRDGIIEPNRSKLSAGQRLSARQCLELFPSITQQTTTTTSATPPQTSEGAGP